MMIPVARPYSSTSSRSDNNDHLHHTQHCRYRAAAEQVAAVADCKLKQWIVLEVCAYFLNRATSHSAVLMQVQGLKRQPRLEESLTWVRISLAHSRSALYHSTSFSMPARMSIEAPSQAARPPC